MPFPHTSPPEVRLHRLASQVHDLGKYAFYQLARELVAASSGALDILETYARLDPALVRAFGVEQNLWRVR
jgi:hypothetical protein